MTQTIAKDALALWMWPVHAFQFGTDLFGTTVQSHQVIAARLPKIAEAMQNPLAADHKELTAMVSEKVAAFGASGRSIRAAGDKARKAAAANAHALGRMAGGHPLWPHEWLELAGHNMAAAAAWATLPAVALAPIGRRVAANEQRLRR